MRYKTRKRILLGLLLCLLVLGAGFIYHQVRQAVYTANLNIRAFNVGVVDPLPTLHPGLLNNHEQRIISHAIYEGLVSYNEKTHHIEPLLAKSWKYSSDGKNLTIYLKKGVTFSNGKKVNAAAVKASWEKNFMVTKEWSNISMFLPIVGANERLDGKTSDISGIKVINEHTLRVEFKNPYAAFPYVLTNAMFWVMDEAKGTDLGTGTGPFTLKGKSGGELVLLRNEKYHQGLPRLTAINVICFSNAVDALNAYNKGELDYLDEIPAEQAAAIRKNTSLKNCLIEKNLMEVYWMGFNLKREPYVNNYLLRRALNYAIDRDSIIKNILGGTYQATRGVIPEGVQGFNTQMWGYKYDKVKAQKLLSEAGYPGGQGLQTLTLTYNEGPGHTKIAAEVARQLGEIGVTLQTQAEDWDYYKKQISSMNCSFFSLGWEADYPDADNYLYSLFHSSKIGVSNLVGYRNPQVDKILDASRAEFRSPEERIKLLQRAEQIIMDDAPCLFLFQKKSSVLISKEVKNLNIDSMGMFDWYSVELLKPEIKIPDAKDSTNGGSHTKDI